MKYKKFLITGCGRSGTGFYANLMRENGYSCGHESFIDFRGIKTLNFIAESSWLAIPYINKIPNDFFIVRTIRNPYKVIKSFYDLAVMAKESYRSPYYQHIKKNLSDIISDTPSINKEKLEINNIANYYIGWNKLFDNKIGNKNHINLCFEEILNKENIKFAGIKFNIPSNIINDKKKHKNKNITICEIKDFLEPEKCAQLDEYYNLYRNEQ